LACFNTSLALINPVQTSAMKMKSPNAGQHGFSGIRSSCPTIYRAVYRMVSTQIDAAFCVPGPRGSRAALTLHELQNRLKRTNRQAQDEEGIERVLYELPAPRPPHAATHIPHGRHMREICEDSLGDERSSEKNLGPEVLGEIGYHDLYWGRSFLLFWSCSVSRGIQPACRELEPTHFLEQTLST
jgi:hypothetical protein